MQVLPKVGKGTIEETIEKISLETTAENSQGRRIRSDVRGSFQTRGQRRPEKLGRRQPTTVYEGRSLLLPVYSYFRLAFVAPLPS